MFRVWFTKARLTYLFKAIKRGNADFSRISKCTICISYSAEQVIIAGYLKLIANLLGSKVHLHMRGNHNDLVKMPRLDKYFLVVPSRYDDLMGHRTPLSKEIETLIRDYPSCKIILVHTSEVGDTLLESLANFLGEKTTSLNIQQLDFTYFFHDLIQTTNQLRGFIMSSKFSNQMTIDDIMTKEVVTVTDESKFSDVYYKMTTVGIRHCPVISFETKKCIGIISRRDLISKIPPGDLILPENVAIRYGIGKLDQTKVTRELMRLGKQKVKDIFTLNEDSVVFLGREDKVMKAITQFTTKHLLGGSYRYIGGIPILDNDRKLVGFVSYVDIFKNFIRHQTDFLEKTLVSSEGVATMPPDLLDIACLKQSDTLSDATSLMDGVGIRSLPVISDISEDELVGFVEDIQIKKFNHKLFGDQIGDLGVEGFMTPRERLKVVEATTKLSEFVENFWVPVDGLSPSSSFAVCEISEEKYKLKGVISYIDVLNAFKDWRQP
jgi:CBS domain-containing protein